MSTCYVISQSANLAVVFTLFLYSAAADVFMWRNKHISAGVLGGATAIWILFELLGYHLLAFLGHALIFSLGVLFLWSNASSFINK